MMSKDDVTEFLKQTQLQIIVNEAVNATVLSRCKKPIPALIRSLQNADDTSGIRDVRTLILCMDGGLSVQTHLSSGLGNGVGTVLLPRALTVDSLKHVAEIANEWTTSLKSAVVGLDPTDVVQFDDISMCCTGGLASHLARQTSETNEAMSVIRACTLAASIACVRLGSLHARLPPFLFLHAMLKYQPPRKAGIHLADGDVSTLTLPASQPAPNAILEIIRGGHTIPTSWLSVGCVGLSTTRTDADADMGPFGGVDMPSIARLQSAIRETIPKKGATHNTAANKLSFHLGITPGRAPTLDDAIRVVLESAGGEPQIGLFVDMQGNDLLVSEEQLKKEKEEAETQAAAAKSKAKPAAKTPAKPGKTAAPTGPQAALWATDPVNVNICGDSEDGASVYDVNANRVKAAAGGVVLDTPAPDVSATAAAAKGKTAATDETDPTHNARCVVSHVRLFHMIREALEGYRKSGLLPAGSTSVVCDVFADADSAAWSFLSSHTLDGCVFASGVLQRAFTAALRQDAAAAAAGTTPDGEGGTSASGTPLRAAAVMERVLKEREGVALPACHTFCLDDFPTMGSFIVWARAAAEAETIMWKAQQLASVEGIEGAVIKALQPRYIIFPDVLNAASMLSELSSATHFMELLK